MGGKQVDKSEPIEVNDVRVPASVEGAQFQQNGLERCTTKNPASPPPVCTDVLRCCCQCLSVSVSVSVSVSISVSISVSLSPSLFLSLSLSPSPPVCLCPRLCLSLFPSPSTSLSPSLSPGPCPFTSPIPSPFPLHFPILLCFFGLTLSAAFMLSQLTGSTAWLVSYRLDFAGCL